MADEMKEFEDAFGVEPEVTEDDVEMAEMPEEAPAEGAADVVAEEAHEDIETPEQEAAEEAVEEEPLDEKELQRKRSWEGRLRAKEAEQKAKEDELRAREDALKSSHPVEKQDEKEAVKEAVEKLEDGFDAETVMREMADDFGEDFANKLAKLIEHKAAQIAGRTVEEKVSAVSQQVESALSGIKDSRVREHFEMIAEAHPDFMDMGESVNNYIAGLPEDEQEAARKIAEAGSARQVVKLLNKVKAASKPEPEVETGAAEGVRSRGIKIPEKPTAASYEDAWDQF